MHLSCATLLFVTVKIAAAARARDGADAQGAVARRHQEASRADDDQAAAQMLEGWSKEVCSFIFSI